MLPTRRFAIPTWLRKFRCFSTVLASIAVVAMFSACGSTKVYNWKPKARAGVRSTTQSASVKAGVEITPQSVLDDTSGPQHQPMWVAVPAGRDGSIVWVQTRRSVKKDS